MPRVQDAAARRLALHHRSLDQLCAPVELPSLEPCSGLFHKYVETFSGRAGRIHKSHKEASGRGGPARVKQATQVYVLRWPVYSAEGNMQAPKVGSFAEYTEGKSPHTVSKNPWGSGVRLRHRPLQQPSDPRERPRFDRLCASSMPARLIILLRSKAY